MKKSLNHILSSLRYLPNRTPEMAFTGETEGVFAAVATIAGGTMYVGQYSGSSEWERHSAGDELVLSLEGTTTVVLLVKGAEQRVAIGPNELVVVPAGTWHRFENSNRLKVVTVTPQPTDHRVERPDA